LRSGGLREVERGGSFVSRVASFLCCPYLSLLSIVSLFLTVQLGCVFVDYFVAYILYYFSTINQSNLGFCTIIHFLVRGCFGRLTRRPAQRNCSRTALRSFERSPYAANFARCLSSFTFHSTSSRSIQRLVGAGTGRHSLHYGFCLRLDASAASGGGSSLGFKQER